MKTAKLTTLELTTILEANRDRLVVWIRRDGTDELVEVEGVTINGPNIQLEVDTTEEQVASTVKWRRHLLKLAVASINKIDPEDLGLCTNNTGFAKHPLNNPQADPDGWGH
tara:strand:+ start:1713 stop:2045 length:333 start_codon:yes stop_codon:yes gene_type:complete